MATDSTVAGYLAPLAPPPTYDQALEDVFQAMCVGITGLSGDLVRPRWQINPANVPVVSINWAAYGVEVKARQWDAYVTHNPAGAAGVGESLLAGSETLHATFSFFGPNSQFYASLLRDGMSIGQNRDALGLEKIKFVEFMEPVNLPALLKDTWNRRIDLKGVFQRWVERTYSIRHFASAPGSTIDNEKFVTPFSVPNP